MLLCLIFECFTEGNLIELGKCDFDITRPDTGAAQRLEAGVVKQTKISVFGAIQRRICIIGEDFSPSLGIHEHGEVVSCISIAYVKLCYICICQSCDFCCIVINLGRHTDIHKCKRICELLVWGRFIVIFLQHLSLYSLNLVRTCLTAFSFCSALTALFCIDSKDTY